MGPDFDKIGLEAVQFGVFVGVEKLGSNKGILALRSGVEIGELDTL